MMTRKRGIIFGLLVLVSYLVFLVATFPAAQAYAWFGQGLPVQAFGLSGTVWSGQAAVAQVEQQRLEAVQWQLKPSRLLLAQVAADVQARLPDGRMSSAVSVNRNNDLNAQGLRVDVPATQLLELAGIRLPARIDGRFDINMRDLQLRDGQLARADGMISWHQAMVNLGRPLQLGTLNLRLEPEAGGVTRGTLLNQGGPLDTSGDLRIQPDGSFTMDLQVRAREGAEEEIGPAMRMLGIPADGTPTRARLTGSLDGTGMQLVPLD